MGLFYKRDIPEHSTLYSVGLEKTKLIVGLGNVGPEYAKTRHNAGFLCVDSFVSSKNGTWTEKKPLKSHVCELREGQTRVIVIKPTTFMNLSGEAVQAVQHFYKIANQDTLVVHDEIDLPFGQIRIRTGGGSAGHNGIKSITQQCGEDYGHIRIGIANDFSAVADRADFVLGKFTKEEQEYFDALTKEAGSIMTEFIYSDMLPADTRSFIV